MADSLSTDLCFSTTLCRIKAAAWQPHNQSGEGYIGAKSLTGILA